MTADQHIDMDAVNALKEVMEDDFVFLVKTFIQDSEARIETLRTLIHSTDADAIRRAAHSFKGSCSNLGALRLAAFCGALEHNGLQANFETLELEVNVIEQEFAKVKATFLELIA